MMRRGSMRMPGRLRRHVAMLLTLALATCAARADTLRIRMIRASLDEAETPAELLDIVAMTRNTMAFKSFSLDAEETLPLPTSGGVRELKVYRVECSGDSEKLAVKITRRDRCIIRTEVAVRRGRPIVLGGFPARFGGGVRMFVLTLEPAL